MATRDAEKDTGITLEHVESTHSTESDKINDATIASFTPEEQKKIIRRIDRRLVLTLGFLYCVSLMDRTNTGIAVVAGMGVDLVLVGSRYSIIVLVFFLTYVFLQPPATVVLRKVGPRTFLPAITLLWGCVMIGMGFVKKWDQLIPLRLLLGVFEAGFFPGCAYLLSCWYPRYELQKRNAVFYLIGSMSSAFSGILAYGFSLLAGHGSGDKLGTHVGPTKANPNIKPGILPGIAGWRWIFILQGVITCAVAIIAFFTIVDFPELASKKGFGLKFLSKEESDFVVARIEKDRHDAIPEEFKVGKYLKNALDLKVWAFATLFMLSTTVTYAIAYFLPIILQVGMGFNTRDAQCLIAPPYVLAAFIMFGAAWLGDKYHMRSPIVIFNGCLCLLGLGLLGYTKNVGVRYFGVFLATAGCNANVPAVLTWQANNIRGQWKRALCSATLVGFGGIGGIIGSTVFREQDKPHYHPGMIATMIASALIIVISLLLDLKFMRANRRADAGGKPIEGLVGFRYTL
ncbi:MFS transporter-like protein 139 [Elsinoe australis]|uniref:MFS transporter-like protein 139 n=1 Tax=Elsinoe australis TaxID=40998 RepID=A0A4U7ATX9_9PEZI|nr:MFS transporter-like protein 139 [Elsinoe australis]